MDQEANKKKHNCTQIQTTLQNKLKDQFQMLTISPSGASHFDMMSHSPLQRLHKFMELYRNYLNLVYILAKQVSFQQAACSLLFHPREVLMQNYTRINQRVEKVIEQGDLLIKMAIQIIFQHIQFAQQLVRSKILQIYPLLNAYSLEYNRAILQLAIQKTYMKA